MPDDLYLAACHRAMREEEHFPLPGTLRRFAGEARAVRGVAQTPYHLRALPSGELYASWGARCRADAERCPTRDAEIAAAWEERLRDARERWGHADAG